MQWLLRLIRCDMVWFAGEMKEDRDLYRAVTGRLRNEDEQQPEQKTNTKGKEKEG